MFTLYKYELKKIFSQKAFIISFLCLFLFMMAVSVTPMVTGSIDSTKAKDAISGRVIDDSLINEAINSGENTNKNDPKYLDIVDFAKYCVNSNEIDGYSSQDLYNKRLETIDKQLGEDYLTEGELDYWHNKINEIEIPLTYSRSDAYTEVYNIVYVLNFITLILMSLSISGIFADEKSSGVDQLLFASKFGRTKLFTAKLFASLTVGLIVPTVMYATAVGVNLFVYGSDGYNTSLQVFLPTSLYSFSIGKSIVIMFFMLLVAAIVYTTAAMLLSIATKNHSSATATMVVIMFLTMFNIPNKYRLLSHLWNILPSGHIGTWTLIEYRLFNVFGHYFNTLQYSPVIWILLSIVFVIIARVLYSKYEVKGK